MTDPETSSRIEVWGEGHAHPHVLKTVEEIAERLQWTPCDLDRTNNGSSPGAVAVMFWLDRHETSRGIFLDAFGRFWDKGVRRLVVLVPDESTDLPWTPLPPPARVAFDQVCRLLQKPDAQKFVTLVNASRNEVPDWVEHRIKETLDARTLYSHVRRFAHGARGDLSNRFLAPARLIALKAPSLLRDHKESWSRVWSGESGDGMRQVLQRVTATPGGKELAAAGRPISDWFDSPGAPVPTAEQLACFMGLLTSCRVQAGEVSRAEAGSAESPAPLRHSAESATQPYRVLVVDDHASDWLPVFRLLQTELDYSGLRSEFFFSLDGKVTHDGECAAAAIQYDSFDLMIVDILLGKGNDGRALLDRIRDSFAQRPVLLWTTSRDEELTAKASLANGVLLKKTLTWDVLVASIQRCLEEGRRRRVRSLPNPFFNDVIRNADYRELVQRMTLWCLKQLDSFHAMDGTYFRYFTDHGGRHTLRLLELLEKAMAPFLLRSDDVVLLRSPAEREFELLSVYLAAVCHELGMFQMRVGPTNEDFGSVGKEYLDDVRKLHAPRGMVLLADREGRFWSDPEGRAIGQEMAGITHPSNNGLTLAHAVAVIVGYHSRCFEELDEDSFLEWTATADRRFAALKAATPSLQPADRLFRETLEGLKNLIKKSGSQYSDRLRRQCAIFRFVDAIDMDCSRNPAQFLVLSRSRSAVQNRENLKRQLCRDVDISDGSVNVKVAVGCADHSKLARVLESAGLAANGIPAGDWSPWALANQGVVRAWQRRLDEWLERVWQVIMGTPATAEFTRQLQEVDVLTVDGALLRLGADGRALLASITALAMAGEVLDEYQAIEQARLTNRLRLARFEWEPWLDGQVPPELTILRDGLDQYGIA